LNLYLDWTIQRLQDDIDPTDFNFTWEPKELGDDFLLIHCNFTKPFSISQNVRFDNLIVHFKKIPAFFNLYETDQGRRLEGLKEIDLHQNYTTLSAIIPRQIKTQDESLIEYARYFNAILGIITFGGILTSFFFKIQIEKFLYVINELQLIFHLPFLNLNVPGNVLVVFT
jgi:hypothetical protein